MAKCGPGNGSGRRNARARPGAGARMRGVKLACVLASLAVAAAATAVDLARTGYAPASRGGAVRWASGPDRGAPGAFVGPRATATVAATLPAEERGTPVAVRASAARQTAVPDRVDEAPGVASRIVGWAREAARIEAEDADATVLCDALVAGLTGSKAAVRAACAALADPSWPAGARSILMDALVRCGRIEGLRGLAELAGSSRSIPEARWEALAALGGAKEFPDDVLARVAELVDAGGELALPAAKALSAAARSASGTALETLAARVEVRLGMRSALDPVLLEALGATRTERALTTLLRSVGSTHEAVREASARALGGFGGRDARETLARTAAQDGSPHVRGAAVRALTEGALRAADERGVADAARVLADAARLDPDATVRGSALAGLARLEKSDPHARAALECVATLSPYEDARARATATLASGR